MYAFLGLSCLACVMEVFGWIGRALSSFAPDDLNYYTVQSVSLPFLLLHRACVEGLEKMRLQTQNRRHRHSAHAASCMQLHHPWNSDTILWRTI